MLPFSLSGQLSTSGTGCFFLIREQEDGHFHATIYTPFTKEKATTLQDWPKGILEIQKTQECVDSKACTTLEEAVRWLASVQDY